MTHGSPANRLAEAHSALRKELIVLISRQRVGLDEELCLRLMGNLALRIMQNFDATCAAVREEIPYYGDAVDELRRRMVDPILRHADRLSREVLAELGG